MSTPPVGGPGGGPISRDWPSAHPWTDDQGQARLQVKLGRMRCSFCARTITKSLSRLDGVQAVSISLAHEEGLISYTPRVITAARIVDTLREIGYSVRDPRKTAGYEAARAELAEEHTRFLAGLGTTAVALGLMVTAWSGHPLAVTVRGHRFLAGQWVMLGLAVASAVFPAGDFLSVAVFITTYHLLSGYASSMVRTRSTQAVEALLDLQPDTARVVRDGVETQMPIDRVAVGECVRIRPGERVPLDGRVTSGHASIDESMVTGESIPVDKHAGDEVIGGSVDVTGALTVTVGRVGEDTFLAQVARHVEEARALKPGIIQLVDRILAIYVPVVLGLAVLAVAVWTLGAGLVIGHVETARAIFAARAVLVLGYPCALGMATPLAMMRGGSMAAEHGILLRSGEAFQVFGQIIRAVLDKTGTLTVGRPTVVELVPADGVDADDLLATAARVEVASETN